MEILVFILMSVPYKVSYMYSYCKKQSGAGGGDLRYLPELYGHGGVAFKAP